LHCVHACSPGRWDGTMALEGDCLEYGPALR
jgi:hypothetical protein